MLAHWQLTSEVRKWEGVMDLISMSITGIAGLLVGSRMPPYRYEPPYLNRKIINKRTNLIPLCVLGIACLFYVHWPPIDTFYEKLSSLYEGYEEAHNEGFVSADILLFIFLFIFILVPTYGFTFGFVHAIVERIILRIVVLTPDSPKEASAGGVSTSTKEEL